MSVVIGYAAAGAFWLCAAAAVFAHFRKNTCQTVVKLAGFRWTRSDFCRGWLITGDTGSGKTRSGITPLLFQVFQNEPTWGGLCIDDKGLYWETLSEMARHFGREDDLILLQVRPDDQSPAVWSPRHRYNLTSDRSIPYNTFAKAVVDTASSLGQAGDKGFFKNQAQIHIAAALETLREIGADVTLENAYHLLLDQGDLDEAMTDLASSHQTVRRRELSEHFSNRFLSQPPEQIGGVKETIANYLQAFITPDVAQVFCPAANTFDFADIDRGKIICVAMPQKFQFERRYVNTFLKMLFYTHALRRFDKPAEERRRDNLLILWADEAQRFVTASEDGMSDYNCIDVIREAQATVVAAAQSSSSFIPPLGREKARVFTLNLRNRLIFKAADEEGAVESADFLGKAKIIKRSWGYSAGKRHKERARKSKTVASGLLRKLWEEQVTPEELAALRERRVARPAIERSATAESALSWAEAHLFERRSVVREHELWRHALEAVRGSSVGLADIKQVSASRDYLRGENNKVAHREMLAREWEIVRAAVDGIGMHPPLARATAERHNRLAPHQQLALRSILSSRSFITLFRGGAGTGKSFVLQRVQDAIERNNRRSVVLAPQRQQVIDLTRDGLLEAQTVSECLQRGTLPDRAVVIVDEAGQLGGRQLLDLIRLVRGVNGRLILSGDTRQHGPVEASDALRAIERYAGLPAAQLEQVRRQEPKRARSIEERKRIEQYRAAVEVAAAGDLTQSVRKLEGINAFVECDPAKQNDHIRDAYLDIAARGESVLVVSQTRAEVRDINNAIRERLRERGLLGTESKVTALEQLDLTGAQKLDARHYPSDCVLVFNRDVAGFKPGAQAKLVGITANRLAFELRGKVRQIALTKIDYLNVCRATELAIAAGDKLQLKANSTTADGRKLANGEIVNVAAIKPNGAIRLQDGRVLSPQYRQFVRGYAVTSYGSQGKTVDHVLFGDSAVRAASNAQQWYVTISRGRKSIRIFTPDKQELQRAIARSGERELALDLVRPNRRQRFKRVVRSAHRGRDFARRICRFAMYFWMNTQRRQHHEIRPEQGTNNVRPNLLAA